MIHRIRELMRPKEATMLDTLVEVDETYVGGKMKKISISQYVKNP